MTSDTTERPIGSTGEELSLALEYHAEFRRQVMGAVPSDVSVDGRWTPLQHGHHIAISHIAVAKTIVRLAERGTRRGRTPDAERVSLLERFVFPYTPFTPPGMEPANDPARDEVEALLEETEHYLRDLDRIATSIESATATLPHPYYGALTPLLWLRFVSVHTAHHLELLARV